ncbi:murein DD-endopeptidase MepM/ murein hydrolase activator NlpD [Micromonospora pisi]|uniref:Murein DD-endopeptidase MepM/ murein hydrolase activator NlpD n=1 Tax=Micromonospora pisi TaxID=589240 RepID=A0A495JMZ4_9ACTN|nr:M23 family metallopeptidase [Micromonospora pisi]RKR90191.1 murein DD-endopeptidase MepM/ murein hydrolase activator NlpD [Micromonospora pisi]
MQDSQPLDDRDRDEDGKDLRAGSDVPRHRAPHRRLGRGVYVATGLAVLIGFGAAALTVGGDDEQPTRTTLAADSAARARAAERADRSERDPIAGSPTGIPTDLLGTPTPSTSPTPSATPSASPTPTTPRTTPATKKPTPTKATVKPTKAAAAWVNPMPGVPVSSCYGMRGGVLHAGIDLAGDENTPIHAAAAGTVITAGAAYDGYGISVVIDHGNGILTHYAHQNRTAVQVGDKVTAGQVIGYEGATGDATGPHLHFEVHQGGLWNQIDPAPFMRAHGVDLGC